MSDVFSREIAPQVEPRAAPRDGNAVALDISRSPEPLFPERPFEGGSDAGDDSRLRARERNADGTFAGRVQRTGDRSGGREDVSSAEGDRDGRSSASVYEPAEAEQAGRDVEPVERDTDLEESSRDAEADEPRYEVTVDGAKEEVSLGEALKGYIRERTFHKRMQEVDDAKKVIREQAQFLMQRHEELAQALSRVYAEYQEMIPAEPNWDQAFAVDPQGARKMQLQYQQLYGKRNAVGQALAANAGMAKAESDRQVAQYAQDGFIKFVRNNGFTVQDELLREIQAMRKTATKLGFTEQEVATTYDPRMLTTLLWASLYDRTAEHQIKPVAPGKGRTLAPGAATPLGNAARKGMDEAQRNLQRSGRLDDATEVFRRLL